MGPDPRDSLFQVELEGHPTEAFGPEQGVSTQEQAWDAYKRKHGDKVRRRSHDKTPVITRIEPAPSIASLEVEELPDR